MVTLLRILLGLVLAGLLFIAFLILWPLHLTQARQLTLPDDAMAWPEVDGDDYPHLATVTADCAACHTDDGGKPFAGGRAFKTPMGTIYASNITPDPETGIGDYTLDQFRAVLVDGVRADGAHLYPAMPYTNYRKLAERDVTAIYDYMMHRVTPVSADSKTAEMIPPFNFRFGVRAWKWLAMPEAGFTTPAHMAGDPQLARGSYLVEGPEHCGACHSPRNPLYIQAGYNPSNPDFLSGGELNGWPVPSLRGDKGAPAQWSTDDLRAYLRTGRNHDAATGGEMTDVIEHSLQHLPDSDMDAIVAYLRVLAPNGGGEMPARLVGKDDIRATALYRRQGNPTEIMLTAADPAGLDLGGRLYLDNCSGCHFADGQGADRVFPSLDGNPLVMGKSARGLIETILNGARLPSTKDAPSALAMPGFGDRLSDDEVAALASFVRSGWSNEAEGVRADEVAKARTE